jgi:hypothetical protein
LPAVGEIANRFFDGARLPKSIVQSMADLSLHRHQFRDGLVAEI